MKMKVKTIKILCVAVSIITGIATAALYYYGEINPPEKGSLVEATRGLILFGGAAAALLPLYPLALLERIKGNAISVPGKKSEA